MHQVTKSVVRLFLKDKMPPFSPAQSKSLPMKTRLKLKLAKIIQSEKNDERRSLKIKPINHIEEPAPVLRRTHSSPSLRSLQETSWSIGRGTEFV